MLWDNIEYDAEVYDYDGTQKTKTDEVGVNKKLLAFYKKLIAIRKNNPALQKGDFKTLLIDDSKKVYVFFKNLSK